MGKHCLPTTNRESKISCVFYTAPLRVVYILLQNRNRFNQVELCPFLYTKLVPIKNSVLCSFFFAFFSGTFRIVSISGDGETRRIKITFLKVYREFCKALIFPTAYTVSLITV
jgi:hypothetical protein